MPVGNYLPVNPTGHGFWRDSQLIPGYDSDVRAWVWVGSLLRYIWREAAGQNVFAPPI